MVIRDRQFGRNVCGRSTRQAKPMPEIRFVHEQLERLHSIDRHHRNPLEIGPQEAVIAADVLGGDCHVNLWLDGTTSGATQVDAATWNRMASELSAVVDADHRLGGVHLYPHEGGKALYPLYAALRRKLKVPLSVATPGSAPDLFQYVDFAVLRPQPCRGDDATYSDRVRDMAAGFLLAATANNGLAMVGVSGLGTPTAGTWYQNARMAVTAAQPIGSSALMGLSVWGLVSDDEGRTSELDPDVWRQMALPLGAP